MQIGSSNKYSKNRKIYLLMIFILLFDLFFLYVSKYSRKNISILEFNINNFGNFLNMGFALIPVLGILYFIINPKLAEKSKRYLLMFLIILLTAPLLFTSLWNEVKLPFANFYLFGYSFEKIFTAILLFTFQFILIYLGVLIWLVIFKVKTKLKLRAFFYSILCILLLVIFAVYFNDYSQKEKDVYQTAGKKDVAVVLGAAVWSKTKPSPIFASRISKASNLYNAKVVNKIQVTGGSAPGELSEAEVAYNYLISYGVEPADIWVEKRTSSTSEQVLFIRENLIQDKKLNSVLIISDRFHLTRVMEICKFYNVKAEGISSDLKLGKFNNFNYRVKDAIALLVFWLFAI